MPMSESTKADSPFCVSSSPTDGPTISVPTTVGLRPAFCSACSMACARAQAIEQALQKAGLKPTVVGTEIVGPSVGEELTQKGLSAFVLSLIGILAYIAFRFEFSFAFGAVIATLHDVLITFAFLAFFRYDLTLNVIAALLTVTGYSTNDTIVIFDRVRENM